VTDAEFIAALEETRLAPPDFRHAGHLRAAYLYLRQSGFEGAVTRMRASLIRYAAAQGRPDLYHETVTLAFLALVNERLHRTVAEGWDGFAAENPDLFDKRILARYYRSETLESPLARAVFVLSPLGDPAPETSWRDIREG
jgi:hypothetical protein